MVITLGACCFEKCEQAGQRREIQANKYLPPENGITLPDRKKIIITACDKHHVLFCAMLKTGEVNIDITAETDTEE